MLAPRWRDDESLYAISDASGWWNLYEVAAVAGATPRPLHPAEEEFAGPLWQLGGRPFELLSRRAARRAARPRRAAPGGCSTRRPGRWPTFTCPATGPAAPSSRSPAPRSPTWPAARARPVGGAADLRRRGGLLLRDHDGAAGRRARPRLPAGRAAGAACPAGRTERVIHALVYPPANPHAAAPDGERPPFVVFVHGGPTSQRAAGGEPGEGVLHQPRHRRHRRELRRLDRLRPGVPGAAARPVGHRRRGRRDARRARARRLRRGGREPGSASGAARPAAGRPSPR